MRKTPAIAAIVGLAAVTLVGCSAPGNGCVRQESADAATTALVTVSGSTDSKPKVEMYTPMHVDEMTFWDVESGEGTPITDETQLAVLDIALVDGATGETIQTTAYDGDLSRVGPITAWQQTFPDLADALECTAAGSRVVMTLPPDGITPEAAEGLQVGVDDSTVAVVDVRKVYLSRANGQNQYISGGGMPTVVRAPDGRPGIIVPDSPPPADLVVQVLKKGDGEVVTPDAPARVHYTGLTWAERTVFETTWDGDPASVTLDGMIPGFAQALEGQTVGSQVIVAVPPELGYGDSAQGSIPPNSTLVFVIDILGIDPPAAEATE